MKIVEMSALELQAAIDRATDPRLEEALREVDRLRSILIDIIDDINTSNKSAYAGIVSVSEKDSADFLDMLDDKAHGYFKP